MRQTQQTLKHEVKGELIRYETNKLVIIDRKDNKDILDFNQLLTDMTQFAAQNQGAEVVVKFIATASNLPNQNNS